MEKDYQTLQQEAANLWEEKIALLKCVQGYNANDEILSKIDAKSHSVSTETKKPTGQIVNQFVDAQIAPTKKKPKHDKEVKKLKEREAKLPSHLKLNDPIPENVSRWQLMKYDWRLMSAEQTHKDEIKAQKKISKLQTEIDSLHALGNQQRAQNSGDTESVFLGYDEDDFNDSENYRLLSGTIEFTYLDANDNLTKRKVKLQNIGENVISGICFLRHDERSFRTDRIVGDVTDTLTGEVMSIEDWLDRN